MKRETLSVLILEPNALLCDLLKLTLQRHHLNPILCEKPGNLRNDLLQHMPDILLIDTHLPGHNGLDLVGHLNSDILRNRTKVFFLSSFGFPEVVQKAAQLGASGFLVKPLNPDLLIRRIQTYFTM